MQSLLMVMNRGLSAARSLWSTLAPVVHFFAMLSLFPAMLVVQFGLELAFGVSGASDSKIRSLSPVGIGLVWLLGVVILVEFFPYPGNDSSESNGAPAPNWLKLPP